MNADKICELLDEISIYFYECYRNAGGGTRACEKFHDYMCAVDKAKKFVCRSNDCDNCQKWSCDGWISIKERLPDKNGQYLCWFGKNTIAKGAAIATYLEMWKAFGSLESLETYPNVTHWMPIEPPKEEN